MRVWRHRVTPEDVAVSEAEDRYLAEVDDDCEEVLGPGMELIGLARADFEQSVRLIARYRFQDKVWESDATGETVVAAHAALRVRLVFDRVRLGFEAVAWRR